MNTQTKLVRPAGFLNVVLDHIPDRELKKVLHAIRSKAKTPRAKKQRSARLYHRLAFRKDFIADLKTLPLEELQNVLNYVKERKSQHESLQGA